ncbi:hypothetical protein BJV82DRAFT_662027 [Fennellomyces sp. T-0311]|nr:hypothetical protein BJV82DRAFT_662027 [Fennellomyces sp. T-0311]
MLFGPPQKTLKKSLHTVLDNALEYVADVCFEFPEGKVWAHRALLLARIPSDFQQQHLKSLGSTEKTITIDISSIVPYATFQTLLRFWYTSEFHPEQQQSAVEAPSSVGSTISNGSTFSTTSTKTSVSSSCSDDLAYLSKASEVEQLEQRLGHKLIPDKSTENDFDQLISDLERMRGQQLGSDVKVTLFTPAPKKSSAPATKEIPSILFTHADGPTSVSASFPGHRFILASQSPYFYAMFCTQFREASLSTVHLPGDLFAPITTEVILRYFYTDKLVVPPLRNLPSSPAQRRLTEKKHALRVLQLVFPAADYLGHFDTICEAILHEMDTICHSFKCLCADCAALLPSMLFFADKHVATLPLLRPTLMALYTDPVHSIAPLWSQQPFATLVAHMAPTATSLAEYTIASIFCNMDAANAPNTLVSELSQQTLENVTKHNAIHVLHSLHLCLSQIRSANPFPTWSTPALDLLNPIVHHTVDMISQNFDFYCVEYPILLSCVDGIGVGFSVDFLEFLLTRVLNDGIRDANAGVLYQGIMRDLVGRQEVVKNVAVDGVLLDARNQCADYLARRWVQVKAQGGFANIDKEVMRSLSDDIGVPYRTLTKPIESDFAAMFGFKSKPKVKSKSDESKHAQQRSSPRRLSLSGLRTQRSNGALKTQEANDMARLTRSRSLSNEAVPSRPIISDTLSAESINKLSRDGLSSQPLIHLLSLESEARRQRQEDQSLHHLHHSSQNPTQHNNKQSASLADALLPLSSSITDWTPEDENVAPVPPATTPTTASNATQGRPSRLKFELPTTPLRAKSPVQKPFLVPSQSSSNDHHHSHRRGRSPRRSRWGIGGSNSDASDDEELVTMVTPVIGAKIELLRRPLPTLGTIKYVGPVNFAKGTWVGVELESRLGKNDGQVEGVRYFRTDPQRGVFVKIDDFKVISLPHVQTI